MPLLLLASGTLSLGVLFWILMIIAIVFGAWANWSGDSRWRFAGLNLLLFVLLFLIGWELWGFPVGK